MLSAFGLAIIPCPLTIIEPPKHRASTEKVGAK